MKSGEDFRRAMGPADDGFMRVIAQVLRDLRLMQKTRLPRRQGCRGARRGKAAHPVA